MECIQISVLIVPYYFYRKEMIVMAEEVKAQEQENFPTKDEVQGCIDKIRPYIQQDGGDIALLGIDENAVVYVAFRGACANCFMAAEDFSSGIRELILDEVPGVSDVMLV